MMQFTYACSISFWNQRDLTSSDREPANESKRAADEARAKWEREGHRGGARKMKRETGEGRWEEKSQKKGEIKGGRKKIRKETDRGREQRRDREHQRNC